jgi:hypothetical protein
MNSQPAATTISIDATARTRDRGVVHLPAAHGFAITTGIASTSRSTAEV